MSTKYKIGDEVPSEVLCERLMELSDAVTKGEKGIKREFYMSIPAQVDHDADLVLAAAGKKIETLEKNQQNLAMLVRQFIAKLQNYDPKPSIVDKASSYLKKHDLLGDLIRKTQ